MAERVGTKERFKVTPSVYLILERDRQILLLQRQNTGYEDGKYSLPAGHKESGEHPTEAVVRESLEEIDVEIDTRYLSCAHVMMRIRDIDSERVDLFFTTRVWEGEPQNIEPEKCSHLGWFAIDNLPENTIPYIREAIKCWRQGIIYSEFE